jgi:epoxyqueuosine reductase
MNPESLKDAIVARALELGFQSVGIAPSRVPDVESQRLKGWLDKDFHGRMAYMNRPEIDRCDARTVLPEARSVIMVTLDYQPADSIPSLSNRQGYVSSYARGPDYHMVVKDKLRALAQSIDQLLPNRLKSRPFVDTAPLVERAFAKAAGLGWYGKNACLLANQRGSFFFLGGLAVSLDLDVDEPVTDHCGRCTACIEACPTDALVSPYQLDSRRCISYLTIEHRGSWPAHLRSQVGAHIFGCDICQSVCPWNRFADPDQGPDFHSQRLAPGPLTDLFKQALTSFKKLTRGTAASRAGKRGLLRNIVTVMGNTGDKVFRPELERALEYEDPSVQEHATWALEQLR